MLWLALLAFPSFLIALRPGVSSSRRLLACTLVVLVPLGGPLLAMLVRRTRGGGIAPETDVDEPQRRLSDVDASRLGDLPSILERLLSGEPTERLSALVGLSSAGDATAVGVLRWTIEHGPPEVVLDAALTLEEIDLRCEARILAACEALAAHETYDRALAAAEASAYPVLHRIADVATAPGLADQARTYYMLAAELEPQRAPELDEKVARLELAAGRPRAALAILNRLVEALEGEDYLRVAPLRDDAAFAARDFSMLSFHPVALALPSLDLANVIELAPRRANREQRAPAYIEAEGVRTRHRAPERTRTADGR
jgi:hypothetical protein